MAEAGGPGSSGSCGSVGNAELDEDRGYAVGDGLRAEAEAAADGGVAQSVRDEVEDLALPVGEVGEGWRLLRRRGVQQSQYGWRNAGPEDRLARSDRVQG